MFFFGVGKVTLFIDLKGISTMYRNIVIFTADRIIVSIQVMEYDIIWVF